MDARCIFDIVPIGVDDGLNGWGEGGNAELIKGDAQFSEWHVQTPDLKCVEVVVIVYNLRSEQESR